MDDNRVPVTPPQRIKRLQRLLFRIAIFGGLIWPVTPFFLIPFLLLHFGEWTLVPKPPEPVSHFTGYSAFGGAIYLQTTTGKWYDCPSFGEPGAECTQLENSFRPNAELYGLNSRFYNCDGLKLAPIPEPPATIIQSFQVCYHTGDYPVQQHVILLENGTIWEWSKVGLNDEWYLSFIVLSCIGGTAGFFVGLFLMFAVWLLWRIRLIR